MITQSATKWHDIVQSCFKNYGTIKFELHPLYMMENPAALRKQMATIIHRFIKRVQVRNAFWDSLVPGEHAVNDCTLLGSTTYTIEPRYHHYIYQNGQWYFFDIRELINQLRTDYNSCNPFTRQPFTRYQKYLAVRKYYKECKLPGFVDLILSSPTYTEYNMCEINLTQALSQEGVELPVDKIHGLHLYDAVHLLVQWNVTMIPSHCQQYMPLMYYHYINGNSPAFRALCYLFLYSIIEEAPDKAGAALIIRSKLMYARRARPLHDPTEPAIGDILQYLLGIPGVQFVETEPVPASAPALPDALDSLLDYSSSPEVDEDGYPTTPTYN